MIFVCLALVATLAAAIFAFAGVLARQQRAHARREDLLVNQLLHAVGKDWQPAPAAERPAEPARARVHVIASPEQHVDVA